jgi:hypothetical protein
LDPGTFVRPVLVRLVTLCPGPAPCTITVTVAIHRVLLLFQLVAASRSPT